MSKAYITILGTGNALALAQVGDNIRVYHELLTHTLGEEHTTLVWHNGGHFADCPLCLAQAFAWRINRITTL